MYQDNKAEATVTITIVPCVRPSYSHFLPDTAVQSSLRNLLSAKKNIQNAGLNKYVIQNIKHYLSLVFKAI